MNLKFVCHERFPLAGEICSTVGGYLPNLIRNTEIIRTEAFRGIFQTWSILPMIERLVEPDWERDIVFVVISGSLYLADLELFEAAYTLDQLILKEGKVRPFSGRPKLGEQLLPKNMPEELERRSGVLGQGRGRGTPPLPWGPRNSTMRTASSTPKFMGRSSRSRMAGRITAPNAEGSCSS